MRQWYWCRSKEQYTCEEVCQNNLAKEKCVHTKQGCKVKPKPMSEEAKERLRALNPPRKVEQEILPVDTPLAKLKMIGAKKAAKMLYLEDKKNGRGKPVTNISDRTVESWIYRGNIPAKYRGVVEQLPGAS